MVLHILVYIDILIWCVIITYGAIYGKLSLNKKFLRSRTAEKNMQTIDKAAGLLSHFSETHTEIGLTELARLSGNDKASVRRCLLAFMKHGLIEQNQATKGYRLGREVLRLARVREISFPLIEVTKPLLKYLRDSTGETAHLSVLAGNKLATIAARRGGEFDESMGKVVAAYNARPHSTTIVAPVDVE